MLIKLCSKIFILLLLVSQVSACEVVTLTPTATITSTFTLISPEVSEGGVLPTEYTCDGAASTLALSWSGAPVGTKSYAVIMHHEASPTDIHWYWVVYDIPVDVTSLPKNMQEIGTLGTNSVNNKTEYSPPCSKGPGPKIYTYTVYALSAEPQLTLSSSQVTRQVLLDAIKDITLASAVLNVTYTRP
jgi:Raf kinase inhibitor-like YbhB/YbcL family protein